LADISILARSEGYNLDIPKIWQYFGELIGPMVQDGSVLLSFLKETCQPLKERGIQFTNIHQSMLKLKTHSGFHDLFGF
jgi:hypothetical protein